MTVLTNSLLKNVENIANDNSATINNIEIGGQLGVSPHLTNLDAATPLVLKPVVPIITHIPTMLTRIPRMGAILKALVERHTKTITGIDWGQEMEEGSGYVLPDGQEVKTPTGNKRTAISPNMTFGEIQGNLVWNFWRTYGNMMFHPDSHASQLASMLNTDNLDPFVFSFFCMDIAFIQFDQTMLPNNIIDTIFVTAMWPKNTGTFGMKKEIGAAETPERAIDFNGILQHNNNTYEAGKAIANILGLHRTVHNHAPAIATSIEDSATDQGIQQEMSNIMDEFNLNPA